jgi:ribonucleoside-diphosphate reductase alpha chain
MNTYSSCILTSINLYSYVQNPFTKESKFDFTLFKNNVQSGHRFLDDVVDLELEKIDKILNKVQLDPEEEETKFREIKLWNKIKERLIQGRRIGLGITAEGDMLAAMGLKYGTKEATEFAIEVHKTFAVETYKSSIQLAKERGCFPIWNDKKEKENPFIKRIIEVITRIEKDLYRTNEIYNDYREYGRRNIACLTIAPNGTLSLMTQTTSGIEPAFEIYYNRKRKVEDGSIIDAQGDHWEEYKVIHHKFVEWYNINHYQKQLKIDRIGKNALDVLQKFNEEILQQLIKESPYYKATANEIDYLEKVEMQGQIQKWIDHSISVTHNLPKNITEEEVSKIYMKAYEVGCKGCTIYVDGSRAGVLTKDEKKVDLSKRPDSLPCDIYVTKVQGKEWIVLVGLDDRNNNRPYEVFAFKQKNLKITHDLPNAQLIKRQEKNKNYYDLIANSHFRLEDIASFFELGEEQSLTRQISLNLRYGIVPINEICDQLEKASGSVVELSKAILRVLKKYLQKNEAKKDVDTCPNCNSTNLVSQGGCISCVDCGWSKCS